jgi:3-methyladenine DNA glycosylase AlkC
MDLKKNFEFLSSANRIGDDIKTVDDLLARDDVNQILSDTVEAKKDIKHLIVAWENEEGVLDWRVTT